MNMNLPVIRDYYTKKKKKNKEKEMLLLGIVEERTKKLLKWIALLKEDRVHT